MTTEIKQLENKLILLGINGMAYNEYWNEIAKRLNKLKQDQQPKGEK